jgi:hypothetical protein
LKLNLTKTHVVIGYKDPVVHAYHELCDLAAVNNERFVCEAAGTLAPVIAADAPSRGVRWASSAGVDNPLKPNVIAREGIRRLSME